MNTQIIHIARNGQEIGAWSPPTVASMRKKGDIQASDYWWVEGMPEWQPMLTLQPFSGKSPGLAAILSLIIPGAGHLYVGHYTAGILFVLCFAACGVVLMTLDQLRTGNAWIVGLLVVSFVLYAVIDSIRKAK